MLYAAFLPVLQMGSVMETITIAIANVASGKGH